MFTSLKRIISAGFYNFRHNSGLSFATCFIVVITLILISSLFIFQKASRHLITLMEQKADISVFLKEDANLDDTLKLKDQLTQFSEVKSVDYVSRDEALQDFTKKHQNESNIMNSLAIFQNPFLAHLNIVAWQGNQYPKIVSFLEGSEFNPMIDSIDYTKRQLVIDRIFSLASMANVTGIILSIILALIATLITYNTIRLAIFNSREEIRIQRLVGASNFFIRGPFLVQGVIAGVLSALVSILILGLISWYLGPKAGDLLAGLNVYTLFTQNLMTLVLIQFASGILLTVFSSAIAMGRYLRV